MFQNYEHMNGHENEETSLKLIFCGFAQNVNQLVWKRAQRKMKALNGASCEKVFRIDNGCSDTWMNLGINTVIKHNFQHFNSSMKCFCTKKGAARKLRFSVSWKLSFDSNETSSDC
jgi:cytochrome c oxidase assembly protein Cox11